MTPLSRSAAPPRSRPVARSASDLVRKALRAGWHTLCSLPVAGCFYVAPYREDDVNQPPTILLPAGGSDTLVMFAPLPAVVAAADPEDDPLVFLWSAPGYGLLASNERAEEDVTTSTAIVPYDPDLDGEVVECLVIDQSERFNDVLVEFFVELE